MKNNLIISGFLLMNFFTAFISFGQYQQYFDGADTGYYTIEVIIDSSHNNVWQIGSPHKIIFDSAATLPNAIVTDTLNSYPVNNSSSFQYKIKEGDFTGVGPRIYAIQWKQKLDFDPGTDGGMIEYSLDTGQTWINGFTSPYIYNFYGYDSVNVDTLANGEIGFTGTDSTWKDIWFCYDLSWASNYGDIFLRHRLVSDSVEQNREGWMIDNILGHETFIHTIDENEKEKFMSVGPNPTKGRVNISTRKIKEYHVIENMELVNVEGQVVQTWGLSPTKFYIDLQNHPNGLYFLKVKTNIQTETFKIILEK